MPVLSKKFLPHFIIVILHVVGVVGTLSPLTRELVIALTPLNLILSAGILLACHQGTFRSVMPPLLFCVLVGFGVEVIGIHTGFPFGQYTYGEVLGWKLLDVPLVIGVNWFLLIYAFFSASNFLKKPAFRVLFTALAMLLIDLLIEPVAIQLGYWSWAGGDIPLQNYGAWFVIALVMALVMHRYQPKLYNPVSVTLILSQILYFSAIFFIKI
ncbi:MAG: carotenoid biosynthesis protein [Marinoscillum sp.]|uniref:carotenoid biosynthesis protein n=1 Tax=Marinoscillum sp. TaxID=2024838 RepID=UPI0032FBF8D9